MGSLSPWAGPGVPARCSTQALSSGAIPNGPDTTRRGVQSEEGSGNVLDSGGPRALETSLGDFKEKEGDDGAVSVLTVLKYPDPRLREVSSQISQFDEDLRAFAGDMVETMYAYRGIGLAAPQVGVNRCLIALDVEDLLEAAELPWRGGGHCSCEWCPDPLTLPLGAGEPRASGFAGALRVWQ